MIVAFCSVRREDTCEERLRQAAKRDDKGDEAAWARECTDMRARLGLSREAKPWSGRPELRGLSVKLRNSEILDCLGQVVSTTRHSLGFPSK